MEKVRFAVVGAGSMGKQHMKYMKEGNYAELVSVCDVNKVAAGEVATEYGIKSYTNYEECFDAGDVEAVLITTPHFFHPPIAIAAMERGLHVLCEKPVAVSVSDADRMTEAAEKTGVKYGVMFQRRTTPAMRKAKEIISSGELGEIWRTAMVETDSFRTQAYYDAAGWRGTWAGEGGGILMNQGPHPFDVFIWLGGMPTKVFGRVQTLHHDIEVEDTASALLTYANGGSGSIAASTWESPGQSIILLVGGNGMLVVEDRVKLRLAKSHPPGIEFARTSSETSGRPEVEWVDVDLPEEPSGHAVITENFVRAIREDEPLIAPGDECAMSLELANAIMLSSYRGEEVELPLDRAAFDELLKKLIESSKAGK